MKSPLSAPAQTAGAASKPPSPGADRPLVSLDAAIFQDVQVTLQAGLGQVELSVQDLLALKEGSVVKLDARLSELLEIRLNGAVVARGEIVAVGDHFGVRIVEVSQGA